MKTKFAIIAGIALLFVLPGCINPAAGPIVEPPEATNELPIVGVGMFHSPNGSQQHAPYEWDIWGEAVDADGYIVEYIIEVNGDLFTLKPAEVGPYGEGRNESEKIHYQFPQAGWYRLKVAAIDNYGGFGVYVPRYAHNPNRNGQWHIER